MKRFAQSLAFALVLVALVAGFGALSGCGGSSATKDKMDGKDKMMDGKDKMMDGKDKMMDGKDKMMDGKDKMMDGTKTTK